MKDGAHTGDLPGHVLRNSRYQAMYDDRQRGFTHRLYCAAVRGAT
jgi:hypothetical protein